jgi:hypothetical protein
MLINDAKSVQAEQLVGVYKKEKYSLKVQLSDRLEHYIFLRVFFAISNEILFTYRWVSNAI